MADGQVVFEITADGKHAIASIKDVTDAIQKESRKWDNAAGSATGDIENSFSAMAKKVVSVISAAQIGKMILDWGKDAISAASDLAEVQNVVDTTFGSGAAKINSWAQTAGKQFGLTELQAKKFASTLGAMMKSSGMAGEEIIDMSTSLSGLAADMASFYNMDFETAFQKIRSGISGETEPLKQLGINMSVANLEAFALEQGITKSFAAMSQGEQTMLRYQYLMQATADAQGDFSKTSSEFANASRRMETAMNTLNTMGGQLLLNTVEPLVSGMATFLEQITSTPEKTVLDQFNEIEVDTAGKLADIQETYENASDLIDVIEEIQSGVATLSDGTTITYESLFGELGKLESEGGDIRKYIASLGLNVDEVVLKYNEWKEATRQLTSLVPGLTSVVDSETGAIDGGTEALRANLEEWKNTQEKKLLWAAYYAKEEAFIRAKAEQAGVQLTADAMRKAANREKEELQKLASQLGIDLDWYRGDYNASKYSGQRNVMTEEQKAYNDQVDRYVAAEKAATKAQEEAAASAVDLSDAEKILADEKAVVIEKTGEVSGKTKEAGEAVSEFSGKSQTAWKEAASAVQEAIKALSDYVAGVHDATEQAVNSVLKGFTRVQRPTADLVDKRTKLIQQQQELDQSTKEGKRKYEELQKQIDELNESMDEFSPKGMKQGLESQLAFMEEYLSNLEKGREMGLSGSLLASLSDGSTESAEYLSQLVANPEMAKEIDEMYQKVEGKKKEFTDTLTAQKLAVDETYQAMVDKVTELVGEMNQGDAAAAATDQTMKGLISGIEGNVDGVSSAVSAIITELDRLSGWGINIDLGSFGSFGFSMGKVLDGSHATGLDYVPFNGYLAQLHEGEGILTAEENRVWQDFKSGYNPQSIGSGDLDSILGNHLQGVKAGGNVYLDGRTVGEVVSARQGSAFRSLQRSGWQQ